MDSIFSNDTRKSLSSKETREKGHVAVTLGMDVKLFQNAIHIISYTTYSHMEIESSFKLL